MYLTERLGLKTLFKHVENINAYVFEGAWKDECVTDHFDTSSCILNFNRQITFAHEGFVIKNAWKSECVTNHFDTNSCILILE